jgi:putative transposase
MTRLKHFDDWGTARFLTFSCYHSLPLLQEDWRKLFVIEHLARLRRSLGIKIYGYVLMPDHMHLVLHPPDGVKLGIEIGKFKALSARAILQEWRIRAESGIAAPTINGAPPTAVRNRAVRTVFWQRRCYDHNCRSRESVFEKIQYCHMNPVRAGLTDSPEKWRWSSCRWYLGLRPVGLEIDPLQ